MQTYRLYYLRKRHTNGGMGSPMSPNSNFGKNIVKRKNINNLRRDLIKSGYVEKMSQHGVVVDRLDKDGYTEIGHLWFHPSLKKWVWDVETDNGFVESRHYVRPDGSIGPKTMDGLIRTSPFGRY